MSDLFDGVETFVEVAKEGSFRGAAKNLGVTPAAVSKAIQRLEQRLNCQVFQRTTRSVTLTVEGELYLSRCQEAIAQLRAGRTLLAMHQETAQGEVTVTMSQVLGRFVASRLSRLTDEYPSLRLRLRLTDRFVDLVEEQSDVALRVGVLEETSMFSQFLHQTEWSLVASPAYFEKFGVPEHPDELIHHRCIKYKGTAGKVVEWSFLTKNSKVETIRTPTFADVDDGGMLLEMALHGVGMAFVFRYMVSEHLRSGRLVEVLREYVPPCFPIHALCMPGQQHNPRIRAVLDFFTDIFDASKND